MYVFSILVANTGNTLSHGKLRKETNCLNCDAQVDGRYCKQCGQENIEPKQTFWGLITHFFNDVTHFDSKFWGTLKPLLLKPGYLTEEYVKGRRMKYIDPVRMYLFVSFAFFLLYLTLSGSNSKFKFSTDPEAVRIIDSINNANKNSEDFLLSGKEVNGKAVMWITFGKDYSNGLRYYDSVQKSLPDSLKSDGISRYFEKRIVGVAHTYSMNPYDFVGNVIDKYSHSFSKVFFISLPIFSLILTILYIRRRKQFFYVSHAIFSLHCYIVAWFFFLLKEVIDVVLSKIGDIGIYGAFTSLIYLGLSIYVYFAMKHFYKQGLSKTLIKWLMLMLSISGVIIIIMTILILNSFFSMANGH
ncbi:hypothetical protein CAP35_04325 [Chitinophagaceae bacterium IBVUCB1]|nr:hypothetical protein CAP35_04325 [Chitinophagaceae bacterium IBVUCB1]